MKTTEVSIQRLNTRINNIEKKLEKDLLALAKIPLNKRNDQMIKHVHDSLNKLYLLDGQKRMASIKQKLESKNLKVISRNSKK